jgi:N6-L-threonylcarbamoyladenine synthase
MNMKILGIESSCDETAAAVVELHDDGTLELHSNVVASSIDLHAVYGGVVPEIAARSHIEHIMPVIEEAVADNWDEIDAIAVTYGPGLGGSLLVGVLAARTLAITKNKPLYAVNHVAAHPFATFITKTSLDGLKLPQRAPEFPMLSLIVSGGHSQLVLFESPFVYELLGRTRDDAIGEAFDKVAKIIGLPYPGGPSIEKFSINGNQDAYKFPKSRLENPYDFSFSGLKTAVLRTAQTEVGKDHRLPSSQIAGLLTEVQRANIAASFQKISIETVVDKTIVAYEEYGPKSVVIAGGVAASGELRKQLSDRLPIDPIYTDMKLCTDNGAMIATLGCFMAQTDQPTADPYTLDISPSLSM